jgi:hypothetical protein
MGSATIETFTSTLSLGSVLHSKSTINCWNYTTASKRTSLHVLIPISTQTREHGTL